MGAVVYVWPRFSARVAGVARGQWVARDPDMKALLGLAYDPYPHHHHGRRQVVRPHAFACGMCWPALCVWLAYCGAVGSWLLPARTGAGRVVAVGAVVCVLTVSVRVWLECCAGALCCTEH